MRMPVRCRPQRGAGEVVGFEGSGSRDPGATMVMSEQSEAAGSLSGCIQGRWSPRLSHKAAAPDGPASATPTTSLSQSA